VQTVSIAQTPFDKRWKMETLQIDTAAAGPAEHAIRVRYLDPAFAKHEFKFISGEAAKYEPDFG
ncbi:MAG: PH domain-containing protein, partial [Pirellulaceae bacterium]|nr:PH domain-containing protein [Pirellulaceae bacterium]